MSTSSLDALPHGERPTEEEMRFFFDLSLDVLGIANFEGRFIRLNTAWEDTLGYTREELMAVPYVSFIHPDDMAATEAEAQKISDGAVTLSFENRYRCKDGTYIWLLWHAKPDLEHQLMYAAARDITAQKVMEETLRQTSKMQRAILDSANFTIISTRPDGIIQSFNAEALRELGYTTEEVVGKVTPEIMHDGNDVVRRGAARGTRARRSISPWRQPLAGS